MSKASVTALLAVVVALPLQAGVTVGVGVRVMPGLYVRTGWILAPSRMRMVPTGVGLVDANIHPKHARLYLDDRFIGIADDFDGYPDYLYLKRGTYKLRCELGGYTAQVVRVEVRAGFRYDVRLRMKRVRGTQKEHWWERPDRPSPLPRVFGPTRNGELDEPSANSEVGRKTGPDLALRPGLPSAGIQGQSQGRALLQGSLRLRIVPMTAALYLDGEFLATGGELGQLVQPVALSPGRHRLDVIAPGYHAVQQEVVVDPGETREIEIELVADGG